MTKYKILGINDEQTECDCCGRKGLNQLLNPLMKPISSNGRYMWLFLSLITASWWPMEYNMRGSQHCHQNVKKDSLNTLNRMASSCLRI